MLRPRYGDQLPVKPLRFKTDQSYGVVPMRMVEGHREFLLVHHNKGHWAFPKGHAEKNETPVEAAIRELREETGMKVTHLERKRSFIEHYEFEKPNGTPIRKTVVYYVGEVTGKIKLQTTEISDYHWGDADETRHLITFGECRALFDEVMTYLNERH